MANSTLIVKRRDSLQVPVSHKARPSTGLGTEGANQVVKEKQLTKKANCRRQRDIGDGNVKPKGGTKKSSIQVTTTTRNSEHE